MKDAWLRCTITPGQFSCEYSVEAREFSGKGFSLFACDHDLKLPRVDPALSGRPVTGFIRVTVIKTDKSRAMVQLPQSTMENGDMVTVSLSDLQINANCAEPAR